MPRVKRKKKAGKKVWRRRYKPRAVKKKVVKKKGPNPNSIFTQFGRSKLLELAGQQVDLQIGDAVQPLLAAQQKYEARQQAALQGLGSMFGSLQPFVSGAANQLGQFAGEARADEQAIFAAGSDRLNALNQERAAETQALSQQLGAEIPVETLGGQVQGAQADYGGLSASDQLAAIGGQGADVAAAQAFAGKVFPLVRTETETQTRAQFTTAINELESEIAHIKSQRGKAIDTRFADLLLAEREFALNKLQMNRDYYIAKQTLGLQKGELTGRYKGKATLSAKQLREQRRQFNIGTREERRRWNAEYGLQQQALAQEIKAARGATATNRAENRGKAYALATALTGGGKAETYTYTVKIPTSAGASGAFESPPNSGKWFVLKSVTKRVPATNLKSPSAVYRELVAAGIGRKMALSVTRARFGLGRHWKPGGSKSGRPGRRGVG